MKKILLVVTISLFFLVVCACSTETPVSTNDNTASVAQVQVTFCDMDTKTVYSAIMKTESPIIIGRYSTSDIVVSDNHVSRTHCELVLIDGSLFVKDMDSTNGTYLIKEGESIKVSEPTEVNVGDVLVLADVYLVLESIE